MSSREPSQSFEAARRQHLIDATIEALADVGFKAASLHQIARRADVSTGLFAHYFGDKDGLLEATLRFMAARLVRATRQRLRAASSPRERLYAVPDSALADQEFERRTSAVWLAFWGQITHSVRYQRIQFIYQRRMLSNLRHDLRALVPEQSVSLYATMIASMIDGVWIRSHASPQRADAAEARAMVRGLIDRLVTDANDGRPQRQTLSTPRTSIHHAADPPARIEVFSPITSDVVATFTPARGEEVDAAIERARLGSIAWQRWSPPERAHVLRECAAAIRGGAANLARLSALGMGRPVRQTIDWEIPRAAHTFDRAALHATRHGDSRVTLGDGLYGYSINEPAGVRVGFGRWSLPLFDPCRQAAATLSEGDSVIVQPAAEAVLAAEGLRDLVEQAGLPAGALTIVKGDEETARILSRKIPRLEGQDTERPAKAAAIIFADTDLDAAARAILHGDRPWAPTPNLSETIVFVEHRAIKAFSACLVMHAELLTSGDPLDPRTEVGASLPRDHRGHVASLVDKAIGEGATLILGGCENGVLLAPTILTGCKGDMAIVRQSLFAPIVTLVAFANEADIVESLRPHEPESAAAIFSADGASAHRLAGRLPAKICYIADTTLATDDIARFWAWIDEEDAARPRDRRRRILCRDSRNLDR